MVCVEVWPTAYHRRQAMSERFWAKVQRGEPDACWPWLGWVGPSGHGRTTFGSSSILASRKAWILTHGRPPLGLCVNHRCDNALCCNPSHMYLGTRSDNMRDMWREIPAAERGPRERTGSVLTAQELAELYRMRKEGATLKECAARFNMTTTTICRLVTAQRKARLAELGRSVQKTRDDIQNLKSDAANKTVASK